MESGPFLRSVSAKSQAALLSGRLQPIETRRIASSCACPDHRLAYVVLRAADGAPHPGSTMRSIAYNDGTDPFLCIPNEMLVREAGEHNVVLNRYPVFPNHLLLTTRKFASQEDDLGGADWRAVWAVMSAGVDAGAGAGDEPPALLGVYNRGSDSGARQAAGRSLRA